MSTCKQHYKFMVIKNVQQAFSDPSSLNSPVEV